MTDSCWILLDTETSGLHAPIYALELGAQLMNGWKPEGRHFVGSSILIRTYPRSTQG